MTIKEIISSDLITDSTWIVIKNAGPKPRFMVAGRWYAVSIRKYMNFPIDSFEWVNTEQGGTLSIKILEGESNGES